MPDPEPILLSQLRDIAIPIATFILGYSLTLLDKFREKRRQVRNIKTIIFSELCENYEKINPYVPTDGRFHPSLVQVPTVPGAGISTAVYDAYLGRLAELSNTDRPVILDAYSHLGFYKTACKEFADMEADELNVSASVEAKLKVQAFLHLMTISHKRLATALAVFSGGGDFLSVQLQEQGKDYHRICQAVEAARRAASGQE